MQKGILSIFLVVLAATIQSACTNRYSISDNPLQTITQPSTLPQDNITAQLYGKWESFNMNHRHTRFPRKSSGHIDILNSDILYFNRRSLGFEPGEIKTSMPIHLPGGRTPAIWHYTTTGKIEPSERTQKIIENLIRNLKLKKDNANHNQATVSYHPNENHEKSNHTNLLPTLESTLEIIKDARRESITHLETGVLHVDIYESFLPKNESFLINSPGILSKHIKIDKLSPKRHSIRFFISNNLLYLDSSTTSNKTKSIKLKKIINYKSDGKPLNTPYNKINVLSFFEKLGLRCAAIRRSDIGSNSKHYKQCKKNLYKISKYLRAKSSNFTFPDETNITPVPDEIDNLLMKQVARAKRHQYINRLSYCLKPESINQANAQTYNDLLKSTDFKGLLIKQIFTKKIKNKPRNWTEYQFVRYKNYRPVTFFHLREDGIAGISQYTTKNKNKHAGRYPFIYEPTNTWQVLPNKDGVSLNLLNGNLEISIKIDITEKHGFRSASSTQSKTINNLFEIKKSTPIYNLYDALYATGGNTISSSSRGLIKESVSKNCNFFSNQ
jgi:hypothetical protein